MRFVLAGLFAAGMMPASSPQLLAETAAEVSGWKGITTDGYASLSYSYNANTPEPRVNQFRVFDFNDNEPQLDVAELVIERAVSQPNQFGFRFDLLAGSGVPEVIAAYGMFRDRKTLVAHHVDIPQLYVRYVVPLGKGLSLDAGKFATHMGMKSSAAMTDITTTSAVDLSSDMEFRLPIRGSELRTHLLHESAPWFR